MDSVRQLKPRLGFGSEETSNEDVCIDESVNAPAEVDAVEETLPVEEPQVSLARLSEQMEIVPVPEAKVEMLREPDPEPEAEPEPEPEIVSLQQLELAMEPETEEVRPALPSPRPREGGLSGCKVGAIGFGRQDIAGLAATMMEERARIEFLPQGTIGGQGEFDLLLFNCASLEMLKRGAAFLKAVLACGTPAIVVGSRTALSVLRADSDPQRWDFAPKPLHMDELVWRAVNLLARRKEAGITPTLPRRVVVADHDPIHRTLIESALTSHGFTCELVEDGEAALAAIPKTEPGAVILDLTLPNRDGFQLLADIRGTTGRKPKLIVLSARQSEADILRAFALGADDYITKPFSPLELHARLTRLLGGGPENA